MLQKFMDMGGYLYLLSGIGALGLAILFVMNAVSRKTIKDKSSYQCVTRKLNLVTLISSVLVLAVSSAAVGVAFSMGQVRSLGLRYGGIGIGAVFLIICYGKFLAFSDRERVLGDYLFRLIDQQQQPFVAVTKAPPTKQQLVEKAVANIKKGAANGENKFSHLLSKEEEEVMREVISEFIT